MIEAIEVMTTIHESDTMRMEDTMTPGKNEGIDTLTNTYGLLVGIFVYGFSLMLARLHFVLLPLRHG